MSLACPTAEKSWRWSTLSNFLVGCTSLRPEATAPEETSIISMPALCSSAIWSTKADMRVTSRVPSRRVKTLLPILTAILLKSISIFSLFVFADYFHSGFVVLFIDEDGNIYRSGRQYNVYYHSVFCYSFNITISQQALYKFCFPR